MIDFDPDKQVLYEDNHLIIINKYSSQIVQGDKTGDEPLSEQIKKYLKEKYNKPGNVFFQFQLGASFSFSSFDVFKKGPEDTT